MAIDLTIATARIQNHEREAVVVRARPDALAHEVEAEAGKGIGVMSRIVRLTKETIMTVMVVVGAVATDQISTRTVELLRLLADRALCMMRERDGRPGSEVRRNASRRF
jgi:hypothetical protein